MSKLPAKIGKGNSLFYALIVAGFLVWNTIDLKYSKENKWSFNTKDPPVAVTMGCFILMGVGLGVNLGGAFQAIADIATIVTRNSVAISTIATKTRTELPLEVVEPETDKDLPKE